MDIENTLTWNDTGKGVELNYGSKCIAVVSYSRYSSFFWYSLIEQRKINTLGSDLRFDDMQQAQEHCLNTMRETIAELGIC
ncbi:hypothetical protein [Photobacterium leiognathi]|uniref:hypothetical protein n=1 Tax=Photobacterium leiognathi TaxID=553611 RepID=UPI0029828BBE|nr:hypothetical protein [Photobacterium leiognathi]